MKTAHATDLVGADPGTDVVITTHLRTYLGRLIAARQARGWVTLQMDDFRHARLVDTIRIRSNHPVTYDPFAPLEVGSIVLRKGWNDPQHSNYGNRATGRVERISRTAAGVRVFHVAFDNEFAPRWFTRRALYLVDGDTLYDLIEEVDIDLPAPRLD